MTQSLVVGPFSRSYKAGRSFTYQRWYRQKPVTSRPLPYTLDKYWDVNGNHFEWDSWAVFAFPGDGAALAAQNTAIYRFDDACRSVSAELGASLATWRQSHAMIVQRAEQLISAVRSLRKGDLVGAANKLGVKKPKKKHIRSLSQQWLELSYGWIPLVADIGNAVDVLQSGAFSERAVRGRASSTAQANYGYWSGIYEWQYRTQVAGKVRIENPNLFLANQLGFVNPATVAWEVVPFSFVVDWFIPVGSFLSHWTARLGLSVTDVYSTHYGIVTHTLPSYGDGPRVHKRVQIERVVGGVPTPTLRPRFTGFYSMRGANAIALLVSQLKSLK